MTSSLRVMLFSGVLLFAAGCSKVCEQKPLEGVWAAHSDLIPPDATTCGGAGNRLQLGFEGKSGPYAFKIMTDFIEAKGWKPIRYGGSSMDSIYEKDGATFSFEVRDPKKPLMDLQFPAEDALKRLH